MSNESFGTTLKRHMTERGLTAYRVAKEAGVDQSLIGRYVRDERFPGRDHAVRVARALGLDDDGVQRLLLPLGYLAPATQRRLRAELGGDQ